MKEFSFTPYLELDTILEAHSQLLQESLRDAFIGYYLQGSLAIGDFDLTSDVDFIVVTKEPLTTDQVNTIQDVHTKTYNQDSRWVKRLEYSFFPKSLLNRFSSPFVSGMRNDTEDRKLWYFDNGSRIIERSDHCNTLVTRWTIREKGIALIGPDPKELIHTIKPNDLKTEIRDTMIGWGKELATRPAYIKNRFYQSYLVLNYARMLHDLHEGRVSSKRDGMNWAKIHLDGKWIPLLDFCWEERLDTKISIHQPMDPGVFEKSLAFVRYTIKQAEKFNSKPT